MLKTVVVSEIDRLIPVNFDSDSELGTTVGAIKPMINPREACTQGDGNSTAVDSDVAVEGAWRGSRIRLELGGDLHRLAGVYGFAGAG